MSEKQTWTCDQLLNANNWSVENFKKNLLPQWIGTWAGDTVLWDWSVDTYSTTVNIIDRVHSSGRNRIRISDSRSLGSW